MKGLFLYIIGVALLLVGCEMEHSDNGDLDGLWQLRALDSLYNGQTVDMRDRQVTWGFQGTLLETRSKRSKTYILRFAHEADILKLYSPYVSDRDHGDVKVEDAAGLNALGINKLEESFKVLHLSSDQMDLQSETLRLHFRKY